MPSKKRSSRNSIEGAFELRVDWCDMPSVNDIATIAEALEKAPVAIVKDRCVAVRNRNATCRACVHVCPNAVIDVAANDITFEFSSCTGCGACIAVCPTEAIIGLSPTDADLSARLEDSTKANDGACVIACARISSKRQADPARYAEVPCLSRLDEVTLLEAVAHGAASVELVDGVCSTCKYRDGIPHLDVTVAEANGLLEVQGSEVRVERSSAFPDAVLVEDASGLFGSTRRGFFSDAVGAAKETALVAAKATIEQELGLKQAEVAIGERLRVGAGGSLPILAMKRHMRALDALDAINGEPDDREVTSRMFADVSLDLSRCNACGMCAVFCPSGAMKRDEAKKASDPLKHIEFLACECVNCGMCADVCWKGAISISNRIRADKLFDFEPTVFSMKDAGHRKKTMFG